MFQWLTIGFLLVLSVLTMGEADDEIFSRKRWAVLIGISHYEDHAFPPLSYAAADARGIRDALLAVPHSGYSQETILVIDGADAVSVTADNIKNAFSSLRHRVFPDDQLLVFISSHGLEVDDEAYLIMSNTSGGDVSETGFALDTMFSLMKTLVVESSVLLIDACHSQASTSGKDGRMGMAFHDALDRGAHFLESGILSSSRLNQESYESDEFRHGVFTHFLIQALKGEQGVDRDHDGQISLNEVAIFVERGQMEWARLTKKIQEPWLVRAGTGKSPILLSLDPEVDFSGARRLDVDEIGTLRFSWIAESTANESYVIRVSINCKDIVRERRKVMIAAILEDGSTQYWTTSIDGRLALNMLPAKKVPFKPVRVVLEKKLYDSELATYMPVRVVASN